MTQTGTQIATAALRELGVIDPTETPGAELIADAMAVGSDLIDSWRTERLTISGVTIAVYSLASGTQSYTIGSGGAFNQAWPNAIHSWSVVPDDDAADPLELPMGRPLTDDQWQAIRIKTQTGPRPSVMYYDRQYAAGLGACLFHPIPNNNDVDVRLYTAVPAITSLVAATSYDLRPGAMRALKLNLAIELSDRFPREVSTRLEKRAADALGAWKKSNIVARESPTRPDYVIGSRSRGFNVYQGS